MCSTSLVHRELEGRECVLPGVNTRGIVDTVKGAVVTALPQRAQRPLAQTLHLSGVGTRVDGRVERLGCNSKLDPVDDGVDDADRVRAVGLEGVALAVVRAGHQVEAVPLGHGGQGLLLGLVGVHDGADGLPVADRRGSGDAGVGFAVVVDHLAAVRLELGQVGQTGLQAVLVSLESGGHPVDHGIVGDVVEVRQVVNVEQLDELGHVFATLSCNVQAPRVGIRVVERRAIAKGGADLVGDVSAVS